MMRLNCKKDHLICFYDMAVSPCSYDFFSYLYAAEICRIRRRLKKIELVFVQGPNKKYRADNNHRSFDRNETFFNNVIIPGLSLLPSITAFCWKLRDDLDLHTIKATNIFPRGYTLDEPVPEYVCHELVAAKVRGDEPGFLVLQKKKKKMFDDFIKCRIGSGPFTTLTFRELDRGDTNKTRSIDKLRWYEILKYIKSKGIEPVVIRDTAMAFEQPIFDDITEVPVASIHLPFRIALYERALMNFTRTTGPGGLLLFGKSRSMHFYEFDESFYPVSEGWYSDHYGMDSGSQFPMTVTTTDCIYEPENLVKISNKLDNLIASPNLKSSLHTFSSKENASLSFIRAVKHLIKCLQSETLLEDAKLIRGLKKLNHSYGLEADIEELLKQFEVEAAIPPNARGQLKKLKNHWR